jgi:hypothetical protein
LEISQEQNDLPQLPKPIRVEEMIECYQKLVASNSHAMLEERVMNTGDKRAQQTRTKALATFILETNDI